MIKINLNVDGDEMEFNLPESWNEVSVKKASELSNAKKFDGKNELELSVSIISILTGIDEEIIYMMSQEQFMEVIEAIKFTNEDIISEEKESILIKGEEYFLKKDFEKLNMGEIISIETLVKQADGNLSKCMSKLLCIFLRKKKENGNLESFKNSFMEREELFDEIMITDVNDLFVFFSSGRTL